jgi:hypothetical protein
VEARLEARLADRVCDRVGGLGGSRRPRLTHPDVRTERLDEVHGA